MAVFSSDKQDGAKQAAQRSGESALTIVASGTRVVGEIESSGVVKIEGAVVGTIRAERQVLVARDGVIDGDVVTHEAIVGGKINGGITAEARVEVQADSVITGDITTARLIVHEGGEVNGNIRMGTPAGAGLTQAPAQVQ
ncbi:MAG TPA: polymer-forming cytoskeletal protein [Gemmatimonadales bacterium]